jgi:formyl-CoA transferase
VIVQPQGWAPLSALIGRPELGDDPEWATPAARLSKLGAMFDLIEKWTLTMGKWEVLAALNEYDIPCGPVLSTQELITEASLLDNDMIVEVDHPIRGSFTTVGCPIKLSDSQVMIETSPGLGEHNEEIFVKELGVSTSRFTELVRSGVI